MCGWNGPCAGGWGLGAEEDVGVGGTRSVFWLEASHWDLGLPVCPVTVPPGERWAPEQAGALGLPELHARKYHLAARSGVPI